MSKYRISVSIDEKNFFWIVVNNGKFIRNPTKEDLMETKIKSYNLTNICFRCREENRNTDNSILYPGNALRECNEKGDWTGIWLCHKCHDKYERENNPNCLDNIKKSLRDCRTGNLDPSCNTAKSDDFEELTYRWKGAKILSKENDCHNGPLDHSVDSKGKIPQTTGRWYDSYNRYWGFAHFEREWDKIFDYEICYCASKDGKDIERIYEIPFKKEIKDKRDNITIVKNPTDRWGNPIIPWYEKYRKDEETVKKVNKIWKEIMMI